MLVGEDAHLCGVRIFTDVYKNKAKAHDILKFAGEVGAQAAQFYADMGCDIVSPSWTRWPPRSKNETFQEFVKPYCQDAIKVIHDAGLTSTLFHLR